MTLEGEETQVGDKLEIEGRMRDVVFVDWEEATPLDGPDPVGVGVRDMGSGELWLRIGSRCEAVTIVRDDDGTWVWHAGRARRIAEGSDRPRPRRAPSLAPGAVTPPTPSTVLRVLVETGQEVEQGQALVVLSAMKMETTLSAPYEGIVTSIHTEQGATVRPGEVLVDIERV